MSESVKLPVLDLPGGTVTSPAGFLAAGVRAGLKQTGLDVALLVSEVPAAAAGVFTTSKVTAAPVQVSRRHLSSAAVRAIAANSGNANACTGQPGLEAAERMCAIAAEALGVAPHEVLVASTGIIGHPLPMDRIERGIRDAAGALTPEGGADAALAIMTTDTVPKAHAVRVALGGREATVGGIAKGAGMIAPNMGTMFCFLTTDAAVEREALQELLKWTVERSFNSITVDGDTSTNDTVLALANGCAGNAPVRQGTEEYAVLTAAFARVTRELAIQLVRDGEGATKLTEVVVQEAASEPEAKQIAMTICNSLLVKTALFGGDPNWGRIAAAAGRAGAELDLENLRLWIGDLLVLDGGTATDYSVREAEAAVAGDTVKIRLAAGVGEASWTAWTCDLSYDYVKINAEYHT